MATAELIELATVGEDNEGNLSITEDREFISLLEQTIPPLCKCHLTVYLVLNPLQLHLSPTHVFNTCFISLSTNKLNLLFQNTRWKKHNCL